MEIQEQPLELSSLEPLSPGYLEIAVRCLTAMIESGVGGEKIDKVISGFEYAELVVDEYWRRREEATEKAKTHGSSAEPAPCDD